MARIPVFVTLLCTLFFLTTAAQTQDDFSSYWKAADKASEKGLTETAIQQVLRIEKTALKQGNETQLLRAAMYLSGLYHIKYPQEYERPIQHFSRIMPALHEPYRQIAHSLLAELYQRYFEQHRYERAANGQKQTADISTWSRETLTQTIAAHYRLSLEKPDLLRQAAVSEYAIILLQGIDSNSRPALLDLLAHRAIDYFKSDPDDLGNTDTSMRNNDPRLLEDHVHFARYFNQGSRGNSLREARRIYALLLQSFNDQIPASDALLDADLDRLHTCWEYSTHENRNRLYETALLNLNKEVTKVHQHARIKLALARLYAFMEEAFAGDLHSLSELRHQQKQLLEQILNAAADSNTMEHARHDLFLLTKPSYSVEGAVAEIPNQPFLQGLKFSNCSTLHYRIVAIPNEWNRWDDVSMDEDNWKQLLKMPFTRSGKISLPEIQDLQEHQTEFMLDGLPAGKWLLLYSVKPGFEDNNNIRSVRKLLVSEMACMNLSDHFVLVNRKTGAPLAGARIRVHESYYDSKKQETRYKPAEQYITNQQGLFALRKDHTGRSIQLEVQNQNEKLWIPASRSTIETPTSKDTLQEAGLIFQDRAIYRPGQTVYVKWISYTRNLITGAFKPAPQKNLILELLNNEGQVIDSRQLRTNEFGSCFTQFVLPNVLLKGNFQIRDQQQTGSNNFLVEAYKRPQFEVILQKTSIGQRLGDSIHISGKAQLYTGSPLTDATGTYRIQRTAIPDFSPWEFSWNSFKKRTANQTPFLIESGSIKTDAKGQFEIHFTANPPGGLRIDAFSKFDFKIEVDITDASGETHQQILIVRAGKKSIQLESDLSTSIAAPLLHLPVRITDMDQHSVPASIQVKIKKLISPDQPFRERFWSTPDIFLISRNDFKQQFPIDAYGHEDEPAYWPADSNWEFPQSEYPNYLGDQLALPKPVPAGWYRIEMVCTGIAGDTLRNEQLVQVTQPEISKRDLLVAALDHELIPPGKQSKIELKTGDYPLHIFQAIQEADQLNSLSYQNMHAHDSMRMQLADTLRHTIGVIQYTCAFVWQNRFYTQRKVLSIRPVSKPLLVKLNHFKDRVLPRSEETWELEVADSTSTAEVLVAMYDASLDQFTSHTWNTIPGIINYHPTFNWSGMQLEGNTDDTDDELMDPGATPERQYAVPGLLRWNSKWHLPGSYSYNWYAVPRWDYGLDASTARLPLFRMVTSLNGSMISTNFMTTYTTAGFLKVNEEIKAEEPEEPTKPSGTIIRKDFRETAFFYPSLRTDSNGRVRFSFKMPDALTRWKLKMLAHDQLMRFGSQDYITLTDKPLTVQSNLPRFFREGDRLELMARITNSSDSELTGTITLNLTDAGSEQSINGWWKNMFPTQYITVPAHSSAVMQFPIEVPYLFNSVALLRFTVQSALFSDAEEQAVPVLSGRMELQESKQQLIAQVNRRATLQFPNIQNMGNDPNLEHRQLIIEMITNPVWSVLQALPYLQEFPHECAEQTFHRLYANLMGLWLTQSDASIQKKLVEWNQSADTLPLNRLEANPGIRQTMIRETPWALDAASQEAHLRSLAKAFDPQRIVPLLKQNTDQLLRLQQSSGGFGWFGTDGPADVYITQVIAKGLAEISEPEFKQLVQPLKLNDPLEHAIKWLDAQLHLELKSAQRTISPGAPMRSSGISDVYWEYLSWRSEYARQPISPKLQLQIRRLLNATAAVWIRQPRSMQVFIARTAWNLGYKKQTQQIVASFKEQAITNPDGTIYWNEPVTYSSRFSNQTNIELQTDLIELFTLVHEKTIWTDGMRNWLLLQKNGQYWPGTKATARVVSVWVHNWMKGVSQPVSVTLNAGEQRFNPTSVNGLYRWVIPGDQIDAAMQQITAELNTTSARRNQPALLQAFWQYRQEEKAVAAAGEQIQVQKEVFLERAIQNKVSLEEVKEGTQIQAGDRLVVRLQLKNQQPVSYVHLRDLRAAGTEPVEVLSGYQFQNSLSFYQTHSDTGTDFFFSELPSGTYQLEYRLQANLPGFFSCGPAQIESMYQPSLRAQSNGSVISIETNHH